VNAEHRSATTTRRCVEDMARRRVGFTREEQSDSTSRERPTDRAVFTDRRDDAQASFTSHDTTRDAVLTCSRGSAQSTARNQQLESGTTDR